MKYQKLKNEDRIELNFDNGQSEVFKIACRDCGLVHKMAIALERNGKIGVAVQQDVQATVKRRKQNGKTSLVVR
jgi:uncharacterized Zn finger protein